MQSRSGQYLVSTHTHHMIVTREKKNLRTEYQRKKEKSKGEQGFCVTKLAVLFVLMSAYKPWASYLPRHFAACSQQHEWIQPG